MSARNGYREWLARYVAIIFVLFIGVAIIGGAVALREMANVMQAGCLP